ncbi:hypothetical protein ACFYO2_26460 [Streptomyces sp. NPDC006602]|uniref:hypothetical protein n=1 Tax=Streptomyces sp. NPDC006602 TaxID=3364751 RepID=UPI0036A93BAD
MPEAANETPQATTVEARWRPKTDEIVRDAESDKVGVYKATYDGVAYLRPVGGGCEWPTDQGNLRKATQEEKVTARLKAENRRSSGY